MQDTQKLNMCHCLPRCWHEVYGTASPSDLAVALQLERQRLRVRVVVSMDPELVKQKAAFKERSMAVPVVEKKRAVVKPSSAPRKKKKSKLKRPKPQPVVTEEMKNSVLVGPRTNMPYRVLKAVVDMMGRRYAAKDYQALSLEEILTGLKLTELRTDTRQWLSQVGVFHRERE